MRGGRHVADDVNGMALEHARGVTARLPQARGAEAEAIAETDRRHPDGVHIAFQGRN
jgi:hypothetical protein